jgi:histone-lysine N-methyltransferase SETMAR
LDRADPRQCRQKKVCLRHPYQLAPLLRCKIFKNWLAAKEIQLLPHPPYSPDLAPADFFLFQKVKEQLAGLHLTQESLKSLWEGVTHTIAEDEFATSFRQ